MQPSWQSTVMGLGFLGLAGFALWLAVYNDFATIWSGVGTIVGVLVGAIPSYFFKVQADSANETAQTANTRAAAYAAIADPDKATQLVADHPQMMIPT